MNPRYELKQQHNNFAAIIRLYFKVIDNGDNLLSPILQKYARIPVKCVCVACLIFGMDCEAQIKAFRRQWKTLTAICTIWKMVRALQSLSHCGIVFHSQTRSYEWFNKGSVFMLLLKYDRAKTRLYICLRLKLFQHLPTHLEGVIRVFLPQNHLFGLMLYPTVYFIGRVIKNIVAFKIYVLNLSSNALA